MKILKYLVLGSAWVSASFYSNSYACGIVGYLGEKESKPIILGGLSYLESRGYDSAGFACVNPDQTMILVKAIGKVKELELKLEAQHEFGGTAIGHTRWATHGNVTELNAHPHQDPSGKVSVVHNGTIENYSELKQELIRSGNVFASDTDSEVIPHLLKSNFDRNGGDLYQSALGTVQTLKGSFAFLAIFADQPNTMILARKSSPLVIGIGENELYLASDPQAFAGKANRVIDLADNTFAILSKNNGKSESWIQLYRFDGTSIEPHIKTLNLSAADYDKGAYEHYMLKEIEEQKRRIQSQVAHYSELRKQGKVWEMLGVSAEQIRNLKSLHLLGCGTSLNAAQVSSHFFREISGLLMTAQSASAFRDEWFIPRENSLYMGISQSGETADVKLSLQVVKEKNLPVCALTNNSQSSMARELKGHLPLLAGPEMAVASTKAFTAQVSLLYWLSNMVALEKGLISEAEMNQAEVNLYDAADKLEATLQKYKPEIDQRAKSYSEMKGFMFLGRHVAHPFAEEAALKLTEISYINAAGYEAGEMKHGRIALVEPSFPVVMFSHEDPEIYKKILNSAQEVKARRGHVIAFAFQGQSELQGIADETFLIPSPKTPLLGPLVMSGLMQYFSYQVAKELGRDIDKPRNLAKSVTVE